VRVAGATVSPGRLDSEFSEALLHALRREVHAAAPAGTPDDVVRLELTGVGAGSAILYLEPAQDSRIQTEDELLQAPDPLDDAVRTVLDLHSATTSLDEHDLALGMLWRARTGTSDQAQLTRTGRDHARPFLERVPEFQDITLTGRVTILDIEGGFTLRTSMARNAPRYEVRLPEETALTDLGLQLGSTVTVRVRRAVARARLGLESRPRYEFLEMVADEVTLT